MSMKQVKAKYISDEETIFFEKGKIYDAFIIDRYPKLIFFYFTEEEMDEEGYYGRAKSLFEIIEE